MESLFGGAGDWGLLALRVALGIIFIYHGYSKLLKVPPIGGPGGLAKGLQTLGFPVPLFLAWVVALVEVPGAAALILGLFTRWVSLIIAIEMAVVIFRVKRGRGVAFTARDTTGWEFDFINLAAALALMLLGAGSISLDAAFGLRF